MSFFKIQTKRASCRHQNFIIFFIPLLFYFIAISFFLRKSFFTLFDFFYYLLGFVGKSRKENKMKNIIFLKKNFYPTCACCALFIHTRNRYERELEFAGIKLAFFFLAFSPSLASTKATSPCKDLSRKCWKKSHQMAQNSQQKTSSHPHH